MKSSVIDRAEGMRVLSTSLEEGDLVVGGLGNQSYDLYLAGDRPENFYMWGAMGLAPSVALGVALASPNSRVVALEGDGGMLMNMGSLATIGAEQPANLGLVIFDNGVYDLTGRQNTAAGLKTDLAEVAKACGIERTHRVSTKADLEKTLSELLRCNEPWCLVVDTAPTPLDREKPLKELRRRFLQLESFIDAATLASGEQK